MSSSSLRRSRTDTQVTLRKAKKEESLAKRRRGAGRGDIGTGTVSGSGAGSGAGAGAGAAGGQNGEYEGTKEDIPEIGRVLREWKSRGDAEVMDGIWKMRKLVSVEVS